MQLRVADDQRNTVVHLAATIAHCRTLSCLLSAEVASTPNVSGVTPLHLAADRGLPDEVQVQTAFLVICNRHFKYMFV